ncbi:MAG: penicillin-binding protein 1B [Proteobacteria bacterium]|nr:penicillin-binding protein 1B [Pseudomonadota bacterium]
MPDTVTRMTAKKSKSSTAKKTAKKPAPTKSAAKKSSAKQSVSKKSTSKNKPRKRSSGKSGNRKKSTKKSSVKCRIFSLFLILGGIAFAGYLYVLDAQITERFTGRIWQLPAHVYARPLELFVGKAISEQQLQFELDYLNYQKTHSLPGQQAQYRRVKNNFEIKTRDFIFWDGKEAAHSVRLVIDENRITQMRDIYSDQNIDLMRFDAGYLTGIFPSHLQDRVLLKLDEVPDLFIKMLLLTEDRRYFSHYGVDPMSIARAVVVNVSSGRTVQGGSTLTQQLVKNLFLTKDKKLSRKINEAFMSLLLELHYDKKTILETYINEIYLGQDGRRAIHGFGLASEFYFGQSLNELTIDQMAVLVGMVKGASYYNPTRNPEHARSRRDVVLTTMQQVELITDRQLAKFKSKPVRTVKHAKAGRYPAFIDLVKHQLQQDYEAEDLRSEGLRVFTTLDPYIQYQTEQAVKTTLPVLSEDEELQAAAVVVSPSNGDVLAIVGDRQPSYKGFNRALNASRPIGSLIKPVIYLAALEDKTADERYTLASMLDDSELVYALPNQDEWKPQNYDRKFHGDVTLYEALIKSYNVPAARTGLKIGLDKVISTLSDLGYRQPVAKNPSLTLGAINMSPVDVAEIYQSFAANGFHSPLRSVHAVLDKDRQPLERYALDVDSQSDQQAVILVNSALIGVAKYGTAKRLASTLALQVAGKTGTSDDLRDSWFAGFSGDVMAVVWTGFDDNRPTTLTGSSGALRIWRNIIQDTAYKPYLLPEVSVMTTRWIDQKNGLLADQGCENALELSFIEGTQPTQESDCESTGGGNWFLDLFD